MWVGFTHYDPFEDTERQPGHRCPLRYFGFTHYDPFEDTESGGEQPQYGRVVRVSPITIRLRILKGFSLISFSASFARFTHYDPFEDTERCLKYV